jgi:hypothetical protein
VGPLQNEQRKDHKELHTRQTVNLHAQAVSRPHLSEKAREKDLP